MKNKPIKLALCGILLGSQTLCAQSAEELAKAAQNPIANMISLPFQNNTNIGIGANDETQNIMNIQPVWPFSINDEWNLITRTIVPIVSQPDVFTGEGRVNGIGDATFTAFLSPKDSGDITWGAGPVFLLPTATDDALGSDKWGAGISAVALMMPGKWVIGSLVSNVWSVGGSGEQDINLFTWQYFINYNMDNGWYLTTAPIITANWEADSDHRWTVPFGGGFGKLFKIGNQPVNAQISAYNNVITPDDYGAEWQVRAMVQFLFPK
jgi:hypothetical protein